MKTCAFKVNVKQNMRWLSKRWTGFSLMVKVDVQCNSKVTKILKKQNILKHLYLFW